MYYSMYLALKQAITPKEGTLHVEWFNNQYEAGKLAADTAVLAGFEPLELNRATKLGGQTSIGIGLHVVTRVIAEATDQQPAAGIAIPDTLVEQNEALAHRVVAATEGIILPFGDGSTRPLQFTGWEQVTKHNGWIVTLLSFRTKG